MTTVPVAAADATDFGFSTRDVPVVASAALLTAGAVAAADPDAADPDSDNRQHGSKPVRAPRCAQQHPDQQQQHDLDLDALLGEQQRWPERIKVKHETLLFVPAMPPVGFPKGEGEHGGRRQRLAYLAHERLSRSVVSSFLRSVALQHLNRLSLWWGVDAFGSEDVPMPTHALIETALHSKPYYCEFWFEDEGSDLAGFQSRLQQRRFYAEHGRLPMSFLRSEAEHVARVMVTPTMEPYRVVLDAHRRAHLEWLRHPMRAPVVRESGVIPKADVAYFEKYGVYPPHWRPAQVAFSQRQQVLADRSWKNRKNEPELLMDLPEGLTTSEQIQELGGLGITVSASTIKRWRQDLINRGMVPRGAEPWHTGTTTAKAMR